MLFILWTGNGGEELDLLKGNVKERLSKKVGGEAKNSGGDFGGDGLLTLGDTLGEKP